MLYVIDSYVCTFATFCCLDHSGTKSTKRSCQKENDEAGEKNMKTFMDKHFYFFYDLPSVPFSDL